MSIPEQNSMRVLRHATRALGLDLSEKRLKRLHFDAWEQIKSEAAAKLAGQRPPGPPNPPEPPLERPVA